jgi:L-lactate dehydrogenase complex protein LldE
MSEPVQLFHTCLVNEIAPEVAMAVVRVLERLGCDVDVPADQTCCGQPAFNAGFHDDARRVARHTIDGLERTTGTIVIPSGSCADMVIHQYARLFEDDPALAARAHAVSARCREFSQFVSDRGMRQSEVGKSEISNRKSEIDNPQSEITNLKSEISEIKVAYHPSCHLLRGLGVDRQPIELIQSIPGATSVDVRDQQECCGFGGLFSVKNADISSAMLARKMDAIEASGADRVVSCDLGCLLHIGGGLHRRGSKVRTQHLAELLDEAAR